MFIKVKVFPNSKKEEIIKKGSDRFEVKVKEKPIEGKANEKVFEILSDYFNVSRSKIKLIKGFKGRNKIFEISLSQESKLNFS